MQPFNKNNEVNMMARVEMRKREVLRKIDVAIKHLEFYIRSMGRDSAAGLQKQMSSWSHDMGK